MNVVRMLRTRKTFIIAIHDMILHFNISAKILFLTSVNLQHDPKVNVAITQMRKTFPRTNIETNFISQIM